MEKRNQYAYMFIRNQLPVILSLLKFNIKIKNIHNLSYLNIEKYMNVERI